MIEEEYYFVTYEWARDSMDRWEKSNFVSKVHPIIWLKEQISTSSDRYRILFWSEIEKEHFDLIDGWID